MSITVADCLKLPALREARLAAGSNGLNRVVTAVSVIEYPKISLISSDLIVGNEMMISALVFIPWETMRLLKLLGGTEPLHFSVHGLVPCTFLLSGA